MPTLPDRIRFDAPIPPALKAEIAERLVPLADAGFTVRVIAPDEGTEALGSRVWTLRASTHRSGSGTTRMPPNG